MRTQNELMVFVALAGLVALSALWAAQRWRAGITTPDPAARTAAVLAMALLGGLVAFGRWGWIARAHGAWFWIPYAAAVTVFAADWVRERAVRRRARRDGLPTGR
jgi:hypothetical protein